MNPPNDRLLSGEEAAAILGISVSTLHRWVPASNR